ncbi:MAG: hypothetical protein AAB657_00970 [Patescibacteria group bacterium]
MTEIFDAIYKNASTIIPTLMVVVGAIFVFSLVKFFEPLGGWGDKKKKKNC